MHKYELLIVEDDPSVRQTLKNLLKAHYNITTAKDGVEALKVARSKPADLVMMDIRLPRLDGLEALARLKELDEEVPVVMLSALDSAQAAVEALKKGAFDYITKPFVEEDLLATLKRCTDKISLEREVDYLKDEIESTFGHPEIVTRSEKMKGVFDIINKVCSTGSNVLITGESGTGKELVARAIHSKGNRQKDHFVAINCGAVPAELMEAEFFGHEPGAFTGAHVRRIGKLEYADCGTVFLDEVGCLPMSLQVKLLRVLQEKSFERVGGNSTVSVDIRIIAATNIDLEKAVERDEFRKDLYYRLNVVPIRLPPLSERKEDIPVLAEHFINKYNRELGNKCCTIDPEAMKMLTCYSWPGNIRELENFIERLVVLSKQGGRITCEDLPVNMFHPPPAYCKGKTLHEACMSFERCFITDALNKNGWNKNNTAKELNIHRNTLLQKMKTLGIKGPQESAD